MDYRVLNLSISQLAKCLEKTSINKYSDKRKESYQNGLIDLFNKISNEDFKTLGESDLLEKKQIIDFIFSSIQYLDNSTLSTIPFEIVFCLEQALNEWSTANPPFIVVTSLSNDLVSYSFNPNLALNEPIFQLISTQYGVKFDYRLIQITLPRYFAYDYLTNVVLYHELGHFVDLKYKISETIVNNKVLAGTIPHPSSSLANQGVYIKARNHHQEFFADIFASQYISNTSNNVLNYLAYKTKETFTHPSTEARIKMVDSFLSGKMETLINEFNALCEPRAKQKLQIRFKDFPVDDFKSLIPPIINNAIELNSIFVAGWSFWLDESNPIIKQFGKNIAYKYINNIIEKAISNYVIQTMWNKQNVSS